MTFKAANALGSTGRLQSSGFSLSQFVLFLHVIPVRLDEDEIRSLCGTLADVRIKNLTGLLQLVAK